MPRKIFLRCGLRVTMKADELVVDNQKIEDCRNEDYRD